MLPIEWRPLQVTFVTLRGLWVQPWGELCEEISRWRGASEAVEMESWEMDAYCTSCTVHTAQTDYKKIMEKKIMEGNTKLSQTQQASKAFHFTYKLR